MIFTKDAPPQVGLIGVSGYATVYVDWLIEAHKRGKVRIASLSVLPSDQPLPIVREIQDLGVKIFDDYQALFHADAPKLDLCFIPTGIQWHARMAVAALRAGCNVLVEKPLAGSVEDALKVCQAEQETGRWVAVGFQDMYTKEIAWLKQSLLDGVIGDVRSISMIGAWPRADSYYERNHWAGKFRADGAQVLDSPLNNAFAHFINLSLFLAGDGFRSAACAKSVQANLYRAHAIESFDTACVSARSERDIEFWFGVSHACRHSIEPVIRIVGDKGYAEWKHEESCAIVVDGQVREVRNVPKYDVTRNEMFESVLRRLREPDTPICDSSIAMCHIELIEALHKSAVIRSVSESAIDHVPCQNDGAKIPAIREVERLLKNAFEARAPLENIACQPAHS